MGTESDSTATTGGTDIDYSTLADAEGASTEGTTTDIPIIEGGEELHPKDDPLTRQDAGATKTTEVTGADEGTKDRGQAFRDYAQNLLRKRLGADYTLPDDVSEENFLDHVEQEVVNSLHPEAIRLQRAMEQGQKPEEFYKNFNRFDSLLSLDDKALLKEHYRASNLKTDSNPTGWTEQEIDEIISGTAAVDLKLRAKDIRDGVREEKRKYDQQMSNYGGGRQKVDVSSAEYRERFNKGFGTAWEASLKNERSFYGVDLSKTQNVSAVQARAKHLLFPDPKTGFSPFQKEMADPAKLLKMSLLWDLHTKGHLNKVASRKVTRGDFIDQLDRKPGGGKSATNVDVNHIDIDSLTRPESLFIKS